MYSEDEIYDLLNNYSEYTCLGLQFAGVKISFNDPVYFGVNGTISTYNPTVANGQMSAVYIWVANGTNQVDSYNCSIQAGWQV